MARITVEDCLEKIPNLFDLVLTASKRSRRLANGAESMVEWENDKPTVVALREIAEGHVDIDILEENEQQQALEAVFEEDAAPAEAEQQPTYTQPAPASFVKPEPEAPAPVAKPEPEQPVAAEKPAPAAEPEPATAAVEPEPVAAAAEPEPAAAAAEPEPAAPAAEKSESDIEAETRAFLQAQAESQEASEAAPDSQEDHTNPPKE